MTPTSGAVGSVAPLIVAVRLHLLSLANLLVTQADCIGDNWGESVLLHVSLTLHLANPGASHRYSKGEGRRQILTVSQGVGLRLTTCWPHPQGQNQVISPNSKLKKESWSNSIMGRVLSPHRANPCSNPSIPYSPQAPQRVIPKYTTGSNPGALLGVVQKQNYPKISHKKFLS